MQVSVGYKKPKSFVLTPTRKKFGKLVARGSKVAIAEECLKSKDLKAAIVTKVGRLIREEVRVMCSNKSDSVLRSTDPETLRNFNCDSVVSEMEKYTPTLLKILKEVTTPPKVRKSQAPKQRLRLAGNNKQNAIIAMSTAILCKNRRPSMCLLQKIISLILQAGRSSKQVCVSIFLLLYTLRYTQ